MGPTNIIKLFIYNININKIKYILLYIYIFAWQRPSKAELHDGCQATLGFDLHMLYAWETFDICTIGDIGVMEIF